MEGTKKGGISTKRWIKFLLFVGLLLLLFTVPQVREAARSFEPAQVENWLEKAGPAAPLFFIIMMTAAVVISPIPSLPLDVAAGAFFGPFLGTIYAVLGGLFGAVISFTIARLLGQAFLTRIFGGHVHFCPECSDKFLGRAVLVARLLPIFSFDIVSYGAGLTRITLPQFIVMTGLGMIPPTALITYFGAHLSFSSTASYLLGGVLVAFFFLFPMWVEKYNFLGLRKYMSHSERKEEEAPGSGSEPGSMGARKKNSGPSSSSQSE